MRPSFVVIGAQKAGTTSLWRYLGRHPRIYMSPIKEPDFFVAEMGWKRGLPWYESLFEPARGTGATAVGEVSPNYTLHPGLGGVPQRMASVIPEARLIYLLRHPVDRMVSGYAQALTQGSETLPIERALLERRHFADISRYAMQLDRYLEHFDRSQILLVLSEDLEREPGAVLDRILRFLGVPDGWRPPDLQTRHHPTAGKRVPRAWWRRTGGLMVQGIIPSFRVPPAVARSPLTTRPLRPRDTTVSPEVRRRLEELLRPDVERLREHLGDGFDGWGLLR